MEPTPLQSHIYVYILGYCKILVKPNTQSSASALPLDWNDILVMPMMECFMNSVRRKVWMMDVSGCQFIYLSLSRKPSETLHQPTSTSLLKSNNWVLVSKKGYKLGEQPLKKGAKEAKSNTSNLWKCFFLCFVHPITTELAIFDYLYEKYHQGHRRA